jgi:membrane protease subunit HflK
MKLPWGIEIVTIVPVQKIQKEEFGFRTLKAGINSQYLGVSEIDSGQVDQEDLWKLIVESGEREPRRSGRSLSQAGRDILQREYIMLTGDLNLIDVEWIVQYRIGDVKKFLFNVREPKQTIRDASQAVMRQLIGNGSVDEALTIGRVENEIRAKEGLQTLLDEYETGIYVVTVKLQSSNPPQQVRSAFNAVNMAIQQKEQRVNEAKKAYNETIPKTRGEAQKEIETAKGYAAERVNEAQGDVAKFERVYAEYSKAPEITKKRMYLETMSKVLPQITEKWIIEQGGADGGILMKLDLGNKE